LRPCVAGAKKKEAKLVCSSGAESEKLNKRFPSLKKKKKKRGERDIRSTHNDYAQQTWFGDCLNRPSSVPDMRGGKKDTPFSLMAQGTDRKNVSCARGDLAGLSNEQRRKGKINAEAVMVRSNCAGVEKGRGNGVKKKRGTLGDVAVTAS